ncbi:ECF RNA polymerase sigma factor SigL [compost metagenome]
MKQIKADSGIPYPISDKVFEQLFRTHYAALRRYAAVILKDEEEAEEIVQQLFLRCWERRELLTSPTSVKAYLYKCVYHDSLNFLKHQRVKAKYQDHAYYQQQNAFTAMGGKMELNELQQQIHRALNELPEQCRTIFQLSRFGELKYREIATELNISVKTVENQMSKALRILRHKLSDFLLFILSGIWYVKDFLK